MYSMVLMMALSGGTEMIDFGRRRGGCHGGGGCYGSCYGGGYGGCYGGGWGRGGGCYGGGWGGCYGGGYGGGWGGCYGGGYGGGWGGCYGGGMASGGCYGSGIGYGGMTSGGCYGSGIGYGGMTYGGMTSGGYPSYGGGYVDGGMMPYGNVRVTPYGSWTSAYYDVFSGQPLPGTTAWPPAYTTSPAPATTTNGTAPATPDRGTRNESDTSGQARGEAPATVIVHLPADATLTVDGQPTRSTSATRRFVTPPLTPGKTYHYHLEARVNKGGEKAESTKDITVRAGQSTDVDFNFPVSKRPGD